jgi:hypothetical protein
MSSGGCRLIEESAVPRLRMFFACRSSIFQERSDVTHLPESLEPELIGGHCAEALAGGTRAWTRGGNLPGSRSRCGHRTRGAVETGVAAGQRAVRGRHLPAVRAVGELERMPGRVSDGGDPGQADPVCQARAPGQQGNHGGVAVLRSLRRRPHHGDPHRRHGTLGAFSDGRPPAAGPGNASGRHRGRTVRLASSG